MGWLKKVKEQEIAIEMDLVTACGSVGPTLLVIAAVVLLAGVIYYVVNFFKNWEKRVEQLSDAAFDAVDVDKSGSIDAKEVEIAVWQLYFKVNKAVRVNPPTREVIRAYLTSTDTETDSSSGKGFDSELDRHEFKKFAKVLVGTVLERAGTMLGATLLCPFVASRVVDLCIVVGTKVDAMFEDNPKNDCFKHLIVKLMPFVNEQLADTVASVLLISVGVPMLFSWYDSYFPTKTIRGPVPKWKQS